MQAIRPEAVVEAGREDMTLRVTDEGRRFAEAFRRERGLGGGEFLVLVPPTRWVTKCYPDRHWRAVTKTLAGRMPVAVIGTAADRALCQRIAAAGGDAAVDLAGQTSIPQMVGLIASAACVVCSDSAAKFIAPAVGTDAVVLIGPTRLERTGPVLGGRAVVADVPCQGCLRRARRAGRRRRRALSGLPSAPVQAYNLHAGDPPGGGRRGRPAEPRGAALTMPVRYALKRLKDFFIYRVLHVDDTPHRIALGLAIGIFVTWTPTMGLQMAITVALAALLRANKAVGVPFVWISNPLTLVPIYYPNYLVGAWLLRSPDAWHSVAAALAVDGWWNKVKALPAAGWNVFWPLWIGSILVGLVLGTLTYFATRYAVVKYREHWHRKHPDAPRRPPGPDAPRGATPDSDGEHA